MQADWKVLVATFGTVFLAELGDKTQIATFSAAANLEGRRWAVFLGSASALVACSALAVLGGAALQRVVPIVWLERVGAVLLVAVGLWMLWGSFAEKR
jgi:Ca2+/H+ antiporter, TMEM165/GDT1 family